eukprot:2199968-Amphidinium_carterae.1
MWVPCTVCLNLWGLRSCFTFVPTVMKTSLGGLSRSTVKALHIRARCQALSTAGAESCIVARSVGITKGVRHAGCTQLETCGEMCTCNLTRASRFADKCRAEPSNRAVPWKHKFLFVQIPIHS